MRSIIFASNNENKVAEIRSVLTKRYNVISLHDAGVDIDIPEPHDTLEANATEKARTIYNLTGQDCFSEDTGLEVLALNGAPGVKSARYAGEDRNFKKNTEKLLVDLAGNENRRAQFRTVISLITAGKEMQFEGICKGEITVTEKGVQGFGYDAVFVPDGSKKTFGEMDMEEKNTYSHRKKAVEKLIQFLNAQHGQD